MQSLKLPGTKTSSASHCKSLEIRLLYSEIERQKVKKFIQSISQKFSQIHQQSGVNLTEIDPFL